MAAPISLKPVLIGRGLLPDTVKPVFWDMKRYVFLFLSGGEIHLGVAGILTSIFFFTLLCAEESKSKC